MYLNLRFPLLLWLFLHINTSRCMFQSSYVKRISYTDNIIPKTNIISQQKAVSGLVCGMTCLHQQSCVSYFFNKQTSDCSIHDTLFTASSEDPGISQSGLKYYHLAGRQVTGGGGGGSAAAANCLTPYTYLGAVSMCIQVVEEPMNWWTANVACIVSGDKLISLDTQAKNDIVSQHIVENYDDVEDSGYYIGGRYYSEVWHWENGKEITSFFWELQYPYPVTSGNKYLALMPESGKWINSHSVARYFICEKDIGDK